MGTRVGGVVCWGGFGVFLGGGRGVFGGVGGGSAGLVGGVGGLVFWWFFFFWGGCVSGRGGGVVGVCVWGVGGFGVCVFWLGWGGPSPTTQKSTHFVLESASFFAVCFLMSPFPSPALIDSSVLFFPVLLNIPRRD